MAMKIYSDTINPMPNGSLRKYDMIAHNTPDKIASNLQNAILITTPFRSRVFLRHH
jgi:hypothetical protein